MQLVTQNGRVEVWSKNRLIGYRDPETGAVYCFDRKRNAVKLGTTDDRRDVIPMIERSIGRLDGP